VRLKYHSKAYTPAVCRPTLQMFDSCPIRIWQENSLQPSNEYYRFASRPMQITFLKLQNHPLEGGTVQQQQPPPLFRLGNPALCGSQPLVTHSIIVN